jgi:hypothetical protein
LLLLLTFASALLAPVLAIPAHAHGMSTHVINGQSRFCRPQLTRHRAVQRNRASVRPSRQ